MASVRPYQASDYPTLCAWWTAQKFPPVPEEMLPRTGAVVDNVCAAFLYATDSKICWIEWIIANPEASKEQRSESLDLTLNTLCAFAKTQGFEAVFTSSNRDGLKSRLNRLGFVNTDENVTQLIRRI